MDIRLPTAHPLHSGALCCYTSAFPIPDKTIRALPEHPLSERWGSGNADAPASAGLALDPQHLHFFGTAAAPPHAVPGAKGGGFIEGLWRGDVLELFLAEEGSSDYQEWNLAPGGAWWTQRFCAPRTKYSSFFPPQGATASWLSSADKWSAHLRLPRSSLRGAFSFSGFTRGNICAILGESPRRYFSLAKLGASRPDFHLPDDFLSLELIDLDRATAQRTD